MKTYIIQLIKYAIFYAMLFGVIAFGNHVHASECAYTINDNGMVEVTCTIGDNKAIRVTGNGA